MVKVKTAEQVMKELEDNADAHIHMPSPSYWPILLAAGLPFVALGLIYSIPVAIVGGLIIVLSMFGWGLQQHEDPEVRRMVTEQMRRVRGGTPEDREALRRLLLKSATEGGGPR